MQESKHGRLITTFLFSSVAFAISYLTNFFLAPYITKHIGVDAYGFITLARNFTNYAVILTTALNSYAARFISVTYLKGDIRSSNKYFSSVFYANIGLLSAILFIAAIGIINLDTILSIPENIVFDTKFLFFWIFIAFAINSLGTTFTASAYIKNRLDFVSVFKGFSYILEAFTILILFFLLGPTLWFVGIGITIAALEIFITNIILTHKLTPELKIKPSFLSLGAVKSLVVNGIWNAINSLGNALNSGMDLFISNLMLSSLAMGQLSFAKTIGTMFSTLYVLIVQPFQPILLKLYSNNKKTELIDELNFSMKIAGFISGTAFAGFVALGKIYFKLWIPTQDIELIYYLTIITIVSSLSEGVICPLYYVYTLTIKNKIPCLVTIIGGVANLLSMYFLLKYTKIGVFAIVGTTAVIMSLINILFNPMYAASCLHMPKVTFFPSMARHLIACICMTICFVIICKVYTPTTWFGLIVEALCDCVVGALLQLLIVFNKREQKKILCGIIAKLNSWMKKTKI